MAILLSCAANWSDARAGSFSELPPARELTLEEFRSLVLQRNESLQSRVLDVEIGRKRRLAEWGAFEPEFVATAQHEYNKRENTAEQASALTGGIFGTPPRFFQEENNIYSAGIEALVPTGAKVHLGYSLRDLSNTVQPARGVTNDEYQTFFGVSLTQPLLRGFGEAATLASIRVAAVQSDIAFQEYRRQMMIVISTAEAAYWNLYMAQEQVSSFRESVELAETVLKDVQAKWEAGKGSELEVLEARAGLALRKTKLNEALEKLYEAANQVTGLFSSSPIANATNSLVRAVDSPALAPRPLSFFESWQNAFDMNPDYLAQRHRLVMEGIRVAYAKNQSLPQLDFKASVGLNGLGDTPGHSWDDITHENYKSWSVGLELRLPLGGGIRARNERDAALLNQKKALLAAKELETQIANALHTAQSKIRSKQEDLPAYESVISYVQDLLQTEISRLEVGRVEARKVLEVEAELLDAKNSLTLAQVQYRRSRLEMELIEGSLLKNRGLEISRSDLESKTAQLLRGDDLTEEQYQAFWNEVRAIPPKRPLYLETSPPPQDPREQGKDLLRILRQRIQESREESGEPPSSR